MGIDHNQRLQKNFRFPSEDNLVESEATIEIPKEFLNRQARMGRVNVVNLILSNIEQFFPTK